MFSASARRIVSRRGNKWADWGLSKLGEYCVPVDFFAKQGLPELV